MNIIKRKIKIPHTSPASQVTLKKVHITCIKDEITFLYKKEKLNRNLYYIHLKAAQDGATYGTQFLTPFTTQLTRNLRRNTELSTLN